MTALLLALSLAYPVPPQCSGGTAWVDSMSDPPAVLQQAKCDGCEAVCDKVGTKSEGWYSSCDGSLIRWVDCSPANPPVACTMDAKLCPDGVTYVGRDGSNNCEWQKCPGEEVPDTQCAPYVCADGTTVDRCTPEGTVINYFAEPCLTHGGEEGAPFKDVTSDHVNADAIFYVKQQGIVQGYEDGTYQPESTINRAEFVKILVTALYKDRVYSDENQYTSAKEEIADCFFYDDMVSAFADGGGGLFVDVKGYEPWYVQYLCIAKYNGFVQGYPDGTFRPGNSINFVEAAKIIVKAFGLEATSTLPACEGDCPWYRDYVLMLEMRGAIPTSVASFSQPVTRGEMAEIIYRLKTGNSDKPSKTYDELAGGSSSSSGTATDDSCTETYASTGVCPTATCIMDCADRDNPPKEGLGCPPGCFAKPR